MQFVFIIILFLNLLLTCPTWSQPEPQRAKEWASIVVPKIKTALDKELTGLTIKPGTKTILVARTYLEKDGTVRNLRIDKSQEQTDLSPADCNQMENALLTAIKKSVSLPYGNKPDSSLKHIGLYVRYDSTNKKLEAAMYYPVP